MGLSKFAGHFNAVEFAYGVNPLSAPLLIDTGNGATGSSTITLAYGYITLGDGTQINPLAKNAPINFGSTPGANQETQTPTAVSNPTPAIYNSATLTATFTYTHGQGETISSGTVGLQEAINTCAAYGGGFVIVDAKWTTLGGTTAILAAAVLPSNGSVVIVDNRGIQEQYWVNRPTGALITAPITATAAMVSVQNTNGTWTNGNVGVKFSYVTATGGETLAATSGLTVATGSSGTASLGGPGPAAEAGAVGYRVYFTTVGGSTYYLSPSIAANGTVIQCGPVAAFAIGTSFLVAAPVTNATALIPGVSTAYGTVLAQATSVLPQLFQTSWPVGPANTTWSSAASTTLGQVQLPIGFLNSIGRTLRVKGTAVITTNSATGTLALNLNLYSVWGKTSITPFTVACPSTAMASAVVNCEFECTLTTTATGATGTLEAHGTVAFNLAGTAVGTLATDFIAAASSTIDLTLQDCLEVAVVPTTVVPTTGTLRQLTIEVLQ